MPLVAHKGGQARARTHMPESDGFISRGGKEERPLDRMEAHLIDGAAVSLEDRTNATCAAVEELDMPLRAAGGQQGASRAAISFSSL